MRFIDFREPNFKCTVRDLGGNVYENIYYSESHEKLTEMLHSLGFEVLSISPYDFGKWKTKAAEATDEIVQDVAQKKSPIKFKESIWGELKQFLFFLSNEKCGYCETLDVRVTDAGQVEHYRPKRKVDEAVGHPGYYWLAYDIENYVPCCGQCNTYRGKRTQFPVDPTKPHAKSSAELSHEIRLLLHPFKDKPDEHLFFVETPGPDQGKLMGKTAMGETSIRVYNLNRSELVSARRRYFELLKERLEAAKVKGLVRKKILEEYRFGIIQYSIMAKPIIERWLKSGHERAAQKAKKALDEQRMFEEDLKILTGGGH